MEADGAEFGRAVVDNARRADLKIGTNYCGPIAVDPSIPVTVGLPLSLVGNLHWPINEHRDCTNSYNQNI